MKYKKKKCDKFYILCASYNVNDLSKCVAVTRGAGR